MRIGTGIGSVMVAVVAVLVVSSANSRTAAAQSGEVRRLAPVSAAHAAAVPLPVSAPVVASAPAPEPALARQALEPSIVVTGERVTSPTLLPNGPLRRMTTAETTPAMIHLAAEIVRQFYAKPVGTIVEAHVAGQRVVAVVERHFHPEGGTLKPWGYHPGVSLFVER